MQKKFIKKLHVVLFVKNLLIFHYLMLIKYIIIYYYIIMKKELENLVNKLLTIKENKNKNQIIEQNVILKND